MKLFNSLTRRVEEFESFTQPKVGVYTCGPTVYDFVTIGNWRTYTLGDIVVRVLTYLGYTPTYLMNITDVGHLTGDNLGDADTGEDRLEKGARREGKTAWEVARFYTDDFLTGYDKLNLTRPLRFTKATDYIAEQIELVARIEAKGFAYRIDDGIYFDTEKYEAAGNVYEQLSTIDQVKAGARVEYNRQKKNPRDFALWKFSYPEGRSFDSAQDDPASRRHMEWDSPWGTGFPGWHVECSAMSMKYLGEQFDIHIGGEDLRSTHHPNEIAQSEAATGKRPFVKYWLHGAFLQVDGGRMGKSLGNAYTLHDIEAKGFSPLALRYFYLTGHYRRPLNFTWEGLTAAEKGYARLVDLTGRFRDERERVSLSVEKLAKIDAFREAFLKAISTDFNLPEALAVVWELVKSNVPGRDKYDLVIEFDRVLGLELAQAPGSKLQVPNEIELLVTKREELRAKKQFAEADTVREEIEKRGYRVEDRVTGPLVKPQWEN